MVSQNKNLVLTWLSLFTITPLRLSFGTLVWFVVSVTVLYQYLLLILIDMIIPY